ncbi:MAG: CARDB domain-containing protein [Saprospiraceae bacterium]
MISDLALRKTLLTQHTVKGGDTVQFAITVYNQGTLNAKNIEITDYINSGYEFSSDLNPDWTLDSDKAFYTYPSVLKTGENATAVINLIVKENSKLSDFINYAEISNAMDEDGNVVEDVDLDMDTVYGNDKGGQVSYFDDPSVVKTDDLIDDDGNIDEDDSDPATIIIMDMALEKPL